jgi:hypothetical protein
MWLLIGNATRITLGQFESLRKLGLRKLKKQYFGVANFSAKVMQKYGGFEMDEIQPLTREVIDRAPITLERGFSTDPMFTWIFSDRIQRPRSLRRLSRVPLEYGLRYGHVTQSNNRMAIVIWIPPDRTMDRKRAGPLRRAHGALPHRIWAALSSTVPSSAKRILLRGDAMGSHPINLAVRFLLELAALLAVGMWGWRQGEGWVRFVLAFGIPIIVAVVWGAFAVRNDPSRSGAAPIAVPGILRLVIELAVFALAIWALYDLGYTGLSWALGIIVAIHYIISYDRIRWLIAQ